MGRQRKQRQNRNAPIVRSPLDQPTRTYVVMRYQVRTPPGMTPEWVDRESAPMDEGYARQLLEGTLNELVRDDYPLGPPIRAPYLVHCAIYETPLTPQDEHYRRVKVRSDAKAAEFRDMIEHHLAQGGTIESGPVGEPNA